MALFLLKCHVKLVVNITGTVHVKVSLSRTKSSDFICRLNSYFKAVNFDKYWIITTVQEKHMFSSCSCIS